MKDDIINEVHQKRVGYYKKKGYILTPKYQDTKSVLEALEEAGYEVVIND